MLPLIDVVFLLLVFFVYAMLSMVLHRGLAVSLPGASTAVTDSRDYIAVTITKDNRLFVNQREVPLETVAHTVRAMLEEFGKATPVFIQGDSSANLGVAIAVLDRLRADGITEVSFSSSETLE